MADVSLPPADKVLKLGNDIDGNIEYVYHYTAETMHAHAAAVSAAKDERIKMLEDALRRVRDDKSFNCLKVEKTQDYVRAALGDKTT